MHLVERRAWRMGGKEDEEEEEEGGRHRRRRELVKALNGVGGEC